MFSLPRPCYRAFMCDANDMLGRLRCGKRSVGVVVLLFYFLTMFGILQYVRTYHHSVGWLLCLIRRPFLRAFVKLRIYISEWLRIMVGNDSFASPRWYLQFLPACASGKYIAPMLLPCFILLECTSMLLVPLRVARFFLLWGARRPQMCAPHLCCDHRSN